MVSKELLEELYIMQGKSQGQIAKELGVIQSRISDWMKKYGIKCRYTWSKEEIEYLETNVGTKKISTMAKELNKSECAVAIKLKKIGAGQTRFATGRLTASELANAFNVDRHVVVDNWIRAKGLKAFMKATREKRKFWQIDIDEFWNWAEENKDNINFSKLEPYVLGKEPDWVAEQRKIDFKQIPRHDHRLWTPEQDKQLIAYRDAGYTLKEIADLMGKSKAAVNKRRVRLQAARKKICIPWKESEVKLLISMREKGSWDKEIAWEIGRETEHVTWKRRILEEDGRLRKLNKSEIFRLRKINKIASDLLGFEDSIAASV